MSRGVTGGTLEWFQIQVKSPTISELHIEGLHHLQNDAEVMQQRLLLRFFRYLVAA